MKKLTKTKNNWTFKDFQKPKIDFNNRKEGGTVFDFDKIRATKYPLIVLMTARGGSKTTQSKIHVLEQVLTQGEGKIFKYVKNMREQTAASVSGFLDYNLKQIEPKYQDVTIRSSAMGLVNELYYKELLIGKIMTLKDTQKLTDSKDLVTDIIFDEANRYQDNRNYSGKQYIQALDHLFNSSYDILNKETLDQRYWFLCNKISMDFEPFNSLEVYDLDDGVNTFNDEFGKFLIVISQKISKKDKRKIEEDNKGNLPYRFGKKAGTAEHSFFNEDMQSSINTIHLRKSVLLSYYNWVAFCHRTVGAIDKVILNQRLYEIYKFKPKGYDNLQILETYVGAFTHYIKEHEGNYNDFKLPRHKYTLGQKKVIALKKEDITENTIYRPKYAEDLKVAYASNSIAFENQSTRANFIETIKTTKI